LASPYDNNEEGAPHQGDSPGKVTFREANHRTIPSNRDRRSVGALRRQKITNQGLPDPAAITSAGMIHDVVDGVVHHRLIYSMDLLL
jgi:hypothetical protein